MPTSRSEQLVEHIIETPASGGANLAFVRHLRPFLTNNHLIISDLLLCLGKWQFFGLVRHLANSGLSLRRLSRNPHPTTYNPQNDALLPLVRHKRPLPAYNPLKINHLPLCSKKRGISPPLRHPTGPTPHNPQPTTHNPLPVAHSPLSCVQKPPP